MIDINKQGTQREFAELIGVSEAAVSTLAKVPGQVEQGETLAQWLRAYCDRLREQAAGRSVDLTRERAGLARENKLRARIAKLKDLQEWAPVSNMTMVLSRVTGQMASVFDGIVPQIKRAYPDLTGEQANIIRAELAKARNLLVSIGEESVRDAAARLVDYIDEFHDGSATEE